MLNSSRLAEHSTRLADAIISLNSTPTGVAGSAARTGGALVAAEGGASAATRLSAGVGAAATPAGCVVVSRMHAPLQTQDKQHIYDGGLWMAASRLPRECSRRQVMFAHA